ncbi:MAG: GNAT family N-acetyltransferase [Acutalibacteraceae bacterium]|nr:GNAT family N-acetyltransferase [Acutalibacteraceae bacterium]
MNGIYEKCKALYLEAFEDDESFTDFLFESCFEKCCYYLTDGDEVVSMLFAFDVFLNFHKGKYIYAVATNKQYRGKGYMRKLFCKVENELKGEYSFFCLRPMNESLFEFYKKLGYEEKFYNREIVLKPCKSHSQQYIVKDTEFIRKIRKAFCDEIYIEYSDEFYLLLMWYCHIITDSIENPTYIVIKEKLSGKIKEFLGSQSNLPFEIKGKATTCNGNQRYAVFKGFNSQIDGKAYLGLAMD